MVSKNEFRAGIRAAAKEFSDEKRRTESEILCCTVLREPHFDAAKCVALYSSLPDEVRTGNLIARAMQTKRVALPVVDGNDMYFRFVEPDTKMQPGAFGISEPCGEICPAEAIDCIVVPGVAFDRQGNRMGRGRGYYDRFLTDCRAFRIGICFSFQIADMIPHDESDMKMDKVLHI